MTDQHGLAEPISLLGAGAIGTVLAMHEHYVWAGIIAIILLLVGWDK